jgi:hypothetical protein
MAQARNHFPLPIRQVEKAVWKDNKARAWPNAILWPINMYLPNEATKIMYLWYENQFYSRYTTQKARASTCATAMAGAQRDVSVFVATARY